MNIHSPARLNGESFSDYKKRRAESHDIVSRLTLKGFSGDENSRKTLRNNLRKSGNMKKFAGLFGRGLVATQTRKNKLAIDLRNKA